MGKVKELVRLGWSHCCVHLARGPDKMKNLCLKVLGLTLFTNMLFACGSQDEHPGLLKHNSGLWLQFGPAVIGTAKKIEFLQSSFEPNGKTVDGWNGATVSSCGSLVGGDENFVKAQNWAKLNLEKKFAYSEPRQGTAQAAAPNFLILYSTRSAEWHGLPPIPEFQRNDSLRDVLLLVPLTKNVLGSEYSNKTAEIKNLICTQEHHEEPRK
jgi:hypothetical protein